MEVLWRATGNCQQGALVFSYAKTQRKEIAMKRMVPIAGLAAFAVLGAGCTNDYDRPYYGYSQGYAAPSYGYAAPRYGYAAPSYGYAAPSYGYYAPARYPAYGYGYPRYGYASPYGSYGGPGITFSASFPQGG